MLIVEASRSEVRGAFDTLKARLLEHPDIEFVTRASITPPGNLSDGSSFVPEGGDPDNPIAVRRVGVDYDYFETLGIEMTAGRTFNPSFALDRFIIPSIENPNTTGGVILNETAARRAGWLNPEDAIGKPTFSKFNLGDLPVSITLTVIGVIPDVHFRSLRSEVSPMGFLLTKQGGTMAIKISNPNTKNAVGYLEGVWAEMIPALPLTTTWLNDEVTQLYFQERKTLNLLASISLLAVFIATLGLFAVANLVTEKRTKEVGLRKFLGAKVRQIVNLFSWQFLKPVLLANILAWPVAWYFISEWLEVFVYRVDLGLALFIIPGLAALMIAWATVATQAWLVARKNPVHALRYE